MFDESTDIADQPQIADFIQLVFEDGVTQEELLDLIPLKNATRGVVIKKAFDDAL